MGINRKVEQATRTMLGHAIRRELDDLAAVVAVPVVQFPHRPFRPPQADIGSRHWVRTLWLTGSSRHTRRLWVHAKCDARVALPQEAEK